RAYSTKRRTIMLTSTYSYSPYDTSSESLPISSHPNPAVPYISIPSPTSLPPPAQPSRLQPPPTPANTLNIPHLQAIVSVHAEAFGTLYILCLMRPWWVANDVYFRICNTS